MATSGRTSGRFRLKPALLTVLCLVMCFAAFAQDAATQAPPAEAPATEAPAVEAPAEAAPAAPAPGPAAPKKWFSGRYEANVDAEWDKEDSDFDLIQTLKLDITPPKYPRLRVHGLVWTNVNLDDELGGSSALRDLDEASDSDVRARLLDLYVEYDDLWGDSTLRFGRQRVIESLTSTRIDGLYFRQQRAGWDWYVFGGARASLYYDTHDDLAAGAGLSWTPLPRTRLALDAYYAEENRDEGGRRSFWHDLAGLSFPRRIETDLSDSLASVSVWQRITDDLTLFGRLRFKDGKPDELLLNATGFVPQWDLTYEVRYLNRLKRAGDRVNDLTAYYRILDYYEQYQDFFIALHRPITAKITLSLEGEIRESEEDSWRTGNRDYQRFALIGGIDDIAKDTDLRLALERWNVEGGEGFWAVTGEATRTWGNLELTVGTAYERYKDRLVEYQMWPGILNQALVWAVPGYYLTSNPLVFLFDDWAVETREDIYSAYARAEWEFRENQALSLRVTYEEDESPDAPYWRVQAGYTLRF
ncbi:MAG TPA: hypothetical protein VMZ06_05035 [Candidatus Bathyarchaeia archaeon]|nr:hypothetical protein [Candidatus Bathyarchaeia archaeon]